MVLRRTYDYFQIDLFRWKENLERKIFFRLFFNYRALNSCDVHTFLRVCAQYPELSAHEKILDNYIELLRKDLVCLSTVLIQKTFSTLQMLSHSVLYSPHIM